MKKIVIPIAFILIVLTFLNCSSSSSTDSDNNSEVNVPVITFVFPVNGDSIAKGASVPVTIKIQPGKMSVSRIRFLIDDSLNQELTEQSSQPDTLRTFNWVVTEATGTHSLVVTGLTSDGQDVKSPAISVRICPAASQLNQMILVSGGSFQMGLTKRSKATHTVTLDSFYIGKHEVTQKEWLKVMSSNPSLHSDDISCPVENITWYDVLVFCNRLSLEENLEPCYTINGSQNPDSWGNIPEGQDSVWDSASCNWSAKGYRMATEAEWEFVARGGRHSAGYKYSGSDSIDIVAWYIPNSNAKTHPAEMKSSNELGLYDLSGNVWEWCWDWYGHYSTTPQTNPHGVSTGYNRVLRGGSFANNSYHCEVGVRDNHTPNYKSSHLGIRLVRRL